MWLSFCSETDEILHIYNAHSKKPCMLIKKSFLMDTYLSILSKINDPETSLVVQGKKIKNQLETIFTEYIFVF